MPNALLTTALLLATVIAAPACVEEPDLGPAGGLDTEPAALGVSDDDGDGYLAPEDCDDTDAAVHPRRVELANGVDDNCSGTIDEPVLQYRATRPSEDDTAPRFAPITLRITDAATLSHLAGWPPLGPASQLGFRLTYQALENASGVELVVPLTTVALPSHTAPAAIQTITLDLNAAAPVLRRRTAYRVKVQLMTALGLPLGPSSDWMYLVTAGDRFARSDALGWGRVDMALLALEQFGDDRDGLIGQFGTIAPDGTRFTANKIVPRHPNYIRGDESAWCDWFVHWVGATASDGADGVLAANVVVDGGAPFWHNLNPNGMPGAFRDVDHDGCGTELVDLDGDGVNGEVINARCDDYQIGEVALDADDNRYAHARTERLYSDATYSPASAQKLGNYVDLDHHAAIFLAFDPGGDGTFNSGTYAATGAPGTVWTVEGNFANRVDVRPRAADSNDINGWGRLTIDMFEP